MFSYALFAWCHLTLFLTGVPGRLMNSSMLDGGLVFYVLPMTLITLNDIMAYFVGFCLGKTPLIKVRLSYLSCSEKNNNMQIIGAIMLLEQSNAFLGGVFSCM